MRLGVSSADAGPKSLATTFDEERCANLPGTFDADDMLEWNDGRLAYRRSAPPSKCLAVLDAFMDKVGSVIATDEDRKGAS